MSVDERLAVIETKLDDIKQDISDLSSIPKLVTQHNEWIHGIQANLKWLWGVVGAIAAGVMIRLLGK